MSSGFERIAVVGATGPTGYELAKQLKARGEKVRVVSRRLNVLEKLFPELGIEKRAGDAMDVDALRDAVEGCDLVVDAIGLPAGQMADHPVVARNLVNTLNQTGGRCLQISSYWCYIPVRQLPVSEDSPREGGPAWARFRREAEDILFNAGAAIVHLPDFFGPRVHTSSLQLPIMDAIAGKPMNWIGGAEVKRDYAFVPDAMNIVAELIGHEQAFGQHWVVPGSGPVSAKVIADKLSRVLGRKVKVRAASPLVLRLISLFKPDLHEFMPMVPTYAAPIRYDAGKLQGLLGELPHTSYDKALAQTVKAMRGPEPQS